MVHQTTAMFCILHSTGNRKGHYRSVIVSIYSPLFHLATYLYKQKEISIYLDRYLSIYLSIYTLSYLKKILLENWKHRTSEHCPYDLLFLFSLDKFLHDVPDQNTCKCLGTSWSFSHVWQYPNMSSNTATSSKRQKSGFVLSTVWAPIMKFLLASSFSTEKTCCSLMLTSVSMHIRLCLIILESGLSVNI